MADRRDGEFTAFDRERRQVLLRTAYLLAVTRPDPGADPRLGRPEGSGLCTVAVTEGRVTGGPPVAGVIVTPLFAGNAEVPLRSMGVTRAAAAELLADPALDVVG